MRAREFFQRYGEFGFTGRLFAALLVASARHETVWPIYVWWREHWVSFGWPAEYVWVASAGYFSFWVWLFVLLIREGKQHHGMIMDAVCGGFLLTVAAALHDPPVRTLLSALGFGAAAWVTFLCAGVLVVARSAQSAQQNHAQSQQH